MSGRSVDHAAWSARLVQRGLGKLVRMIRALVVDDEPPARRRLVRLLDQLAADPALPPVTVVGEAGDGEAALTLIDQTSPSLLFLDIHMPGLDGLALAQRYVGLPPIVFTTAFDQHAVAAFAVHAVDYLLKPLGAERLAQAIVRASARVVGSEQQPGQRAAMATVFSRLVPKTSAAPKIVVRDRGSVRLFDARTIARFYAIDKYTAFVDGGREQLSQESLGELEERLASHGFVRIHRGELINLQRVCALHPVDGSYEVELADGQRARVSRRCLPQLRSALQGRLPIP